MPYRYLDDIATADAAFEASGASAEEVMTASVDAMLNVMVENIDSVKRTELRTVHCTASSYDMLLFDLLEELIFLKDTELLFLRVGDIRIGVKDHCYYLTAEAHGERIDSNRHQINVDVKAVTLYRLSFKQVKDGWRATVVLDI
ncbi:archease [Candidatus Latescibacterota bacterium]